jgi:putative pyoverdin transport system ATP-binding/permease protein
MQLLRFLWRNSKSIAIFAVIAGILSGVSNAGLIALIHKALGNSQFPAANLIGTYVGLCALLLVTNISSQLLLLHLSQKAIFTLRLQLCANILKAPLRRLEEAGSPRLFAALTTDASTISNALLSIPLICIAFTTVTACLVYVGWLSRYLLISLLVFMALGVLSYRLPIRRALRLLRLGREEADTLFAHFRALIDGNKELKLHRYRRGEFYQQDLRSSAATVKRYNLVGMTTYIIADGWGKLLYFIYMGLLLFSLSRLTHIDGPTLTGYVLVILYMMGPINVLLNLVPSLGQTKVALQKLEVLGLALSQETWEEETRKQTEAQLMWEHLELENVTHAYHHEKEDTDFTLGPLNLSFRPGEVVFLVGGNGSGKSTFAKILTGLYVPESGKIRLDGKSITDYNREVYRQLFSAVFSDFYLFERLRNSHISNLDEMAHDYLVQLQLDHKVRIEEGMFSTTALSQGQRKRLALLTAYLDDRPFYVFDEWAADQDPHFKQIFYTQILQELKNRGKTVLVISHDDRYYHVADRIIKLEFGQCLQN